MAVSRARTVLYVANSSLIGGANRVLMDMVSGIDPTRFRAVLACPSEGPLLEWARAAGTPAFVIPASSGDFGSEARRAARLAALILRTGASFIHAIDPACYRAASWAAKVTGALRVCHIQFPPSAESVSWVFRVRPHLAISCYQGHVSELTADLPELRGILTALSNAVRDDAFTPPDAGDDPSRWRFGRSKMVLIVGHLSDIKGHPTFLRAAALIRQQFEDCAFVALGGETIQPGFQRELEALADSLGIARDVHFLGWRKEVSEIVRAADVFVLPSLKEGLPLAMLEAMACSVPVVATPVNGIPEVVTSGVNGQLIPVNEPDQLAAAVLQLLRNPAQARALGAAGRATVERDFSMRKFLAELQEMYEGLLEGRAVASERGATTVPAATGA